MKKILYSALFGLFALAALMGCEEDSIYVENRHSTPQIISIVIENGNTVSIPGKLVVSYKLADPIAPLSTLAIKVRSEETTYIVDKVRTKGNSVEVENYEIDFPFLANIADNQEVEVLFTLENVDGNWCQEVKKVNLVRPTLPDEIYFISGEDTYTLAKDSETGIYAFDEGAYPSSLTGFVATNADLDEAEYIWGSSGEDNVGQIVSDRFAEQLSISYGTWIVSQFTFNPYTFEIGVKGVELNISVNGTQLLGDGQYLYGKVQFTKDSEFSITGVDASKEYNRDFMEYNPENGNYKFTGESGVWEVFYSYTYKYFWVCDTTKTAPEAYWMIGNGFCQAPVWQSGHPDGWVFDDIKQMGFFKNQGDGTYQLTLYINSGFDLQIYKELEWDTEFPFTGEASITAPEGIIIHSNLIDIVEGENFVPGYYKLIFSPESTIQMTISKVGE